LEKNFTSKNKRLRRMWFLLGICSYLIPRSIKRYLKWSH
jgi:hypothetical protein